MMNQLFNEYIKNNLLWSEGRRDLLIAVLCIIISLFLNKICLFLSVIFCAFHLFFYRNPLRILPKNLSNDDSLIISPADGKVILVEANDQEQKVSIFLSPFNVHVNWIPMNGIVESITYKPGKFLMAFKSESSELNERNDVVITNKFGTITTRQVAGFLARRIACWVSVEQKIQLNEKYGMIKFGSRIDLFLPINVKLRVQPGEKVKGGLTIIGNFVE